MKVILGISGGIAAYKAPFIIRLLKQNGCEVQVVCTKNALKFVTKTVLETLSGNQIYDEMFPENKQFYTEHISITDNADIMIVAPATANCIGKFATGIADDALSTTYMAFDKPIFIAPAMNAKMWKSKTVQKNIETLKSLNNYIINPIEGELACGYNDIGKMENPSDIVDFVFNSVEKKTLCGKKILITAGPTYEKIDSVRFIGNFSSGKMGFALAESCTNKGANVVLVSGPTSLKASSKVKLIEIESADQMLAACLENFDDCSALIMAAAVADYKPENQLPKKIKKEDFKKLAINLTPNKDILATLASNKKNQIIVGFALETDNEIENAKKKLINKHADLIILNSPNDKNSGFGFDTNKITIIHKNGKIEPYNLMSKAEAANKISDTIETLLKTK